MESLESRSLLATITVTSLADGTLASLAGDGKISLREAIHAANTNASVDGSPAGQAAPAIDTIVFQPGLNGTVSLNAGELTISQTVVIQGLGAANTILDANHLSRVFFVSFMAGDVTLTGLTVQAGRVTELDPNGANGGGILSQSNGLLTVTDSTISANLAEASSESQVVRGGGIWASGAVTVSGSTIRENTATNHSDFFAEGGGIWSTGAVTLTGSTISGNVAFSDSGPASGAGILAAGTVAVTITGSTISGNSAISNSGSASGGGITANGFAVTVTATGSTISGNSATSMSVSSAEGGGMWVTGAVTVTGSTISGNSATASGSLALGGGISASDAVSVTGSTISGNSAKAVSDLCFAQGGGIFATSPVIVTGSTISGNSATASGTDSFAEGGGILSTVSVSITLSTITGNSTTSTSLNAAGGGIFTFDAPASIHNSIVAGNTDNDGSHPDLRIGNDTSALLNARASLIGTSAGTSLTPSLAPDTNGNIVGGVGNAKIDPLLGPLANNGGPTQTHALRPLSPALDRGNNTFVPSGTTTDQRGNAFNRFVDGPDADATATVDMGAFERQVLENLSLVVDTAVDENDGNFETGDLSLREAIVLANESAGADTITFASALQGQTITLNLGELAVSNSVAIQGPGPDKLTISGGSGATQSRVFAFRGSGANTYALSGVTMKDGNGKGLSDGFGGAINFFDADDRLSISDAVIRDSSALTGGLTGGGLFADSGTIDLERVTVANNSATFGGGLAFLEADGSLVNVTVSGNTASTRGGGLILYASRTNATGNLRLINSTVAGNVSAVAAGIRINTQNNGLAVTLTIGNTIVANNTGGGVQLVSTGTGATIVSLGNNLSSDASGNLTQPGDLQNTDPKLGPLANNGGGLLTHALLLGSPARNAGNESLAQGPGPDGIGGNTDDVPLATDARGVRRVVGSAVDIGAYERLHVWHNTIHALDVVGSADPGPVDAKVVPADALAIINFINAFGSQPVPDAAVAGPPYYDTSDDDFVAPNDVLAIINHINAFGSGTSGPAGEGESTPSSDRAPKVSPIPQADLIALLATDTARTKKSRAALYNFT